MLQLALLVCFAIHSALSVPTADNLVIELPDGKIQGTTYVTTTNKTYFGFQGIPYATPPIGNLRFEAPQPPEPWNGIFDATKDGKDCLTVDRRQNPDGGYEDCLYINVYTPAIKPEKQLPVLFWIYGGAFILGNSAKFVYGPDFLVEEDVILITFNYRLGPFGFLSTGDLAIKGNAGLKDQYLALKWTHDNIALFGGDPEKITIFGESAGGASTGHHLLSKKSAGLFRAVIVQSGSAIVNWAIDQDPITYTLSLVEALSYNSDENDTQKIKEFLQEKTVEEIEDAALSLYTIGQHAWPVIEVEHEGAFISESPYGLLESGNFNQVPIMIGICAEESLMFLLDLDYAKQSASYLDAFPSELIPGDLRQNSSDNDAVIKAVQNIYLKDGETFSSNLVALAKQNSDNTIVRGTMKHAELSSNYVSVYLYQFAYYGRAITEPFIDGAEKAAHSAELPFIFKYGNFSDTTYPDDVLTQNRMTKLWTNFAKFLDPTPEPSELLNNITWPIISPTNLQFLNINGTLEVRPSLKENSFPKWNNIYKTYGNPPFVTF